MIGNVHQFIGHCLIPLDPSMFMPFCKSRASTPTPHVEKLRYKKCVNYDCQLGILWDKTMDNKLIHIPNYDKQSYPFFRLRVLDEQFGHY